MKYELGMVYGYRWNIRNGVRIRMRMEYKKWCKDKDGI